MVEAKSGEAGSLISPESESSVMDLPEAVETLESALVLLEGVVSS